ncbi:unnamed protein product [Symbiodinium necroappetens]|uniref:Uncharacterized protein n=1 Tax=Symbiodinium necroappetens TaxID=1628268 RepID=A0A813BF13_9DINO|nr:unnamed protein product [Symbiodinium necroappetens]
MCGRTPEEVTKSKEVWGQYTETGERLGSACRVDKETVEEGWPGLPFQDASKLWHSKEQKSLAFRTEYATARRIKKDTGILQKRFNPSSTVQTGKIRFRMVFHDIGFLTDAEFASVVGASSSSLKLKTHRGREQIEDREESVQGVYVSLRDLPDGLLGWIRKVRSGFLVQVQAQDKRLTPAHQIRQGQGQVLFDHFSEVLLNSTESASRSKHRPSLPKIPSLIEQLNSLQEEKEAAEQAEQEEENDGQEGEHGEEEENFMEDPCIGLDEELPKNDQHSVISSQLKLRPDLLAGAAGSVAGSFDQPMKAKQTSSKARRKKKDILEDDDQASAEAEEATQVDPSEIPQWMKDDDVLSQVVKKLGKIHKCFHHLNPRTGFEQRLALGHQLRGVARHVIMTSALPVD